ncbi:MAG TPA: metallophosphoesterase, partial [Fimbriimonas sp.]|nr:metallophosphoesterase [Fimbriimonas sp.]
RRDVLKAMGLGAAAAIVPAGVADLSSNHLVLEEHELRLPRWDADGFRVAIVSDFHANDAAKAERASNAIKLALAQKPDLIAMPGDFLDSSDEKRLGLLADALEPLREARCPVVSTMGNHDYWTKAPRKIVDLMSERTKLLRNDTFEASGVTVAGVDDAIAGRHRFDFLHGRHSKSLLALFHEPDYVREMPEHVSLQLSGHSHGGQICLPNGRAVQTPKGAKIYIKGFYPDARVPIYVTRGVGTTGPDCRLFCLPEVTLLTLRGT